MTNPSDQITKLSDLLTSFRNDETALHQALEETQRKIKRIRAELARLRRAAA
jgi:predicted RNase H-like nuclease (RuvC/YqgF family)